MASVALVACGGATNDADSAQTPDRCMRGERPLEVTGHSFTGRYLMLDVSYPGGCAEHTFRIWWSGAVGTSNPPVVPLELHHYVYGGDACEAVVTNQIVVDCAELDAIAGSPRAGDPVAVRISLLGAWWTSGQPIPEFRYEVPDTEVPPPAGEPVVPIERDCGGITG